MQTIDKELAIHMRQSGCEAVYLGLESGSQTVLNNMNKRASLEQYLLGVSALREADIKIFAAFIVGFPGESEATIKETASFIEKLGIHYYGLKDFYYMHTAPIHNIREKYGLMGEGYKWVHNTMSSHQVAEAKVKIFDLVSASRHIDPDMGLWYLICLREKGFSWEQIDIIQDMITSMTKNDNSGKYADNSDIVARIREVVGSFIESAANLNNEKTSN